jgi:hypothetical protein
MRPLLRILKPSQLLWITVVSNGTITLTGGLLAAKSWHLTADQHLSENVRFFGIATIFLSYVAALATEFALLRGIRSRVWTDAQLSTPRRLFSHAALPISIGITVVIAITYFIVAPLRNSTLGVFFLAVPLSLGRMSNALRPKETVTELSSGLALYPTKPLHSDQWGR